MRVEWSCCFCDKKESFSAPTHGNLDYDSEEEEEGYLLCTCCEKQSTWFHADKEICLQRFRERAKSAKTEEKRQEAEDAAARVQTAHRNVQYKQSRKRGGESYFFYNCEDCSALECFGCKKASLTREEPHNIGTLRASLCAVCGEKASCSSRKYKGKNYTRGIDSDVYLCSSDCEKKFGRDKGRGSPANKTVTLDAKQTRIINNAITNFEKESIEQFQQRRQSLSKWLTYFEKRDGDDGKEVIVPTLVAKQDLTNLIPSEVHFATLMGSDRGTSFTGSKTEEEKITRGKLLVDHIKFVVSRTEESERNRMRKMKESNKNLTEEQKSNLAMTHLLVDSMDNVSAGLRKGELSLEDVLLMIETDSAVGIGGNDMLEHYKSKYLAAKDVEASEDRYMDELKSQVASFEAQRDSLKATSGPLRDGLYKILRDKIRDGVDIAGEDDDNDNATVTVAKHFSFSVLNKPVWPIVHQKTEGISPVCVKVNFWQWAWYHEHRALKDKTTEAEYLRLVETAVKDIVPGNENVQEETIEESDAEDETKVETVEEFKAYFSRLKKTWQERHFTLRGRKQSKVLTLDAVPLEWQPADSDVDMEDDDEEEDVDMEDDDEEEDVVMEGVEEEEEEAPVLQELSQELIVATAKHFKICVDALSERYNTSVVHPDFQWTESFPKSVPFDKFAMEDASERAKNAIEKLVEKTLPKLKECANAYRTVYNSLCSGKKDVEEASHKEKQNALDTKVKATVENFSIVQNLLRDKQMKKGGQECFVFVMNNNALFHIAKIYFASTANKKKKKAKKKVMTMMEEFRIAYKDAKAVKKITYAWTQCKKAFETAKEKRSMLPLSFEDYVKMALKSTLGKLSKERAAFLKEKEENRVEYMKFLTEFVDNKAIADAKEACESAKEELRVFLREELNKLYVNYTMYYGGENDNDDIDTWFPMLSRATKANRERVLMEAEEDISDAKLFKYDLRARVSKWKDSIQDEADEETNREFSKEEERCFKYFQPNLDQPLKEKKALKEQKALKKEKDTILDAYKRHTMFHHLGHASFVDCGIRAATKLGYDMNRGVFAQWEERSLKKYMKYYEKNFNPKNEKDPKIKKKLDTLYDSEAAEEGRSVALAQIREAAVMRWRKQIIKFKVAWKSNDDDKMDKCRKALKETFCKTGWMEGVRSNERTVKGLEDAFADQWSYKDDLEPSNKIKQPSIFETKIDKIRNPEGLWEQYADDDAIFGVKPGDEEIRGNPEKYLIKPVDGDEMSLDVMAASYCPQCGLATFSDFTVYDQPYSGYFPDRNMYPNARFDNKNLQFCGVGDEYETNTKLIDRAKLHFAVHVGLREKYVEDLEKFTTRQFVTLGHTQCETLPNGGCLEAFTRKQAVDSLEEQRKDEARKAESKSRWKKNFEFWKEGVEQLTTPELLAKHAKIFRVDVRIPLWQGKKVRAPPGYRLVQYPKKGWTWQLEPFFDPLQTPLLNVKKGKMQWHSQKSNVTYDEELENLSALCQTVGTNIKNLHNIERFQCEDQGYLSRHGSKQFVYGKPYAWLLPVAPAVDADEDNKLNDVQNENAKIARAQLGFDRGSVKKKEWQPQPGCIPLTWYIEDVVGGVSGQESDGDASKRDADALVRRLVLRRNTFLAQQRQIMKRCQTELSRYLIRRKNKTLTSLYKLKTSTFVREKMDAYSNLSFSHKEYKFKERPNLTSAAAPPEEVEAWMTSILTDKPLRMYECKLSGKPCIYVQSRKNNLTDESIAACAQASPPQNTVHFVTKQQFDIETDKSVQKNLKKFINNDVKMNGSETLFSEVLNKFGREKHQHGFDTESGSGPDSGSDSDADDATGERVDFSKDEEEAEGVTKAMEQDGWVYYPALEQYYRKEQGDRSKMYTTQKPILCDDGKYYAFEEIDHKDSGEQAGGKDGGEESSSDDEEMGDWDFGAAEKAAKAAAAAEADAAADAAAEAAGAAEAAEAEARISKTETALAAAFEAVAAAQEAADKAEAAREAATEATEAKTAAEAEAAFKSAKAAAKAAKAAKAATAKAAKAAAKAAAEAEYAERFRGYIADAAQRARPSKPGEYDKQVGVQCGRHATNNFLELEESDRRKMIARFQEREPLGANRGYASGTIASMFQISKRDDFAVSIAENSKPFTEDEWNAIRDNKYFMGFIARPPEEDLQDKTQREKARQLNKLKSQRTALHAILNLMELQQAALDKTIVLMCRQYIEGKSIPSEVKAYMTQYSTLYADFLRLIKIYVEDAGIQQAVNSYESDEAVLREMRGRDRNLLKKIMALQTGWHWVAVRKYALGKFYVINSQGPTVTEWIPTVENANKFSITKILVFSNVEEAGKLQAKNESEINTVEKEKRKQEFGRVTQIARDILKDTFGRSDEEVDDLLGPADEDSDSDSSSGGAAAQRPTKRRKTGALFRMLREMYI